MFATLRDAYWRGGPVLQSLGAPKWRVLIHRRFSRKFDRLDRFTEVLRWFAHEA